MTDSDSDFEALESIARPPVAVAASSNAASAASSAAAASSAPAGGRDELYTKLGENAILRAQLLRAEQDAHQKISELLKKQTESEQRFRDEIQRFRQLYESERSVHLMRAGDEQLSIGRRRPAPPGAHVMAAAPKRQHVEFGDGFVVRPQAASASAHADAAAAHADADTAAAHTLAQQRTLTAFLLQHRAPGLTQPTIQVLFGVPLDGAGAGAGAGAVEDGASVGHALLRCRSLSELSSTLLALLEAPPFRTDRNTLFLSLLFDAQFEPLEASTECRRATPLALCALLAACLDALRPLPALSRLDALALVSLEHARLLVYALYCMDVLLAADWLLELPVELAAQLLEGPLRAPQIRARAIDLFAKYPRAEFAAPAFLEAYAATEPGSGIGVGGTGSSGGTGGRGIRHSTSSGTGTIGGTGTGGGGDSFDDAIELLFCGLHDARVGGSSTSIISDAVAAGLGHQRFARLVPTLADLPAARAQIAARAVRVYEYALLASVRLARALLRAAGSERASDAHVLGLLQLEVDSYPFRTRDVPAREELIHSCVAYLWTRPPRALRETLATDLVDLCVCLVRVARARRAPADGWAREILAQVKPADLDLDML